MVPLQENIEKIYQLLHLINSTARTVGEIQKSPTFKVLFERLIETNEINGVDIWQTYTRAYCIPTVHREVFSVSMLERFIGTDVSNVLSSHGSRISSVTFGLRKYWTVEDFQQLHELKKLQSPKEILLGALMITKDVLRRSPRELGIVCGPISTGRKSVEENLHIFNRTIYKIGQTMPMFNQMPLERLFAYAHELLFLPCNQHLLVNGSSSDFFIDEFYLPIFALNKIWKPHFIYDWQYSSGATREHRVFRVLRSSTRYLEKGFDVLHL